MHITIFGIPTHIESSTIWMVVLFLITGVAYIRKVYQDGEWWEYLLGSLGAGIAIVISVFVHEFAHAVVAQNMGIPIVAAGSSWWGAYVQPGDVPITVSQIAWVGFAGPASSMALGLIAAFFVRILPEGVLENSFQYFARVSIQLAALNMFPYWGLDGQWVHEGIRFFFGIPDYGIWSSLSVVAQVGPALFVYLFCEDWLRSL